MKHSVNLTMCLLLFFATLNGQPPITFEPIVTGLSSPVDIVEELTPDKRLFVVEQGGTIQIISGNAVLPQPFANLSSVITQGGERGLLSMAFHPNYATNRYFFVWYTNRANGAVTLARYMRSAASANVADASSGVTLFTIQKRFNNHNGAKINFGPDGFLYVATGDGGSGGDPDGNAQNGQSLLGKMLRIDVNNPNPPYYSIPATNPFAGSGTTKNEIIAQGLRNPWRWSFDKETGDMWIADVGQGLYEEINWLPNSNTLNKNYGWNCFEGTNAYNVGCTVVSNKVTPIFEYGHNSLNGGYSVTGGYVYRGNEYPVLQGYYLCADYVSANGWLVKPNGTGGWNVTLQTNWMSNITGFGEASNGTLYAISIDGTVAKIVPVQVLAVKLLSFMAVAAGSNHLLTWTVQNQEAGDEYRIEKGSSPAGPFALVQTVKSNGNNATKTYRQKLEANNGPAWYRLQVKGTSSQPFYSAIAHVPYSVKSTLTLAIVSDNLTVRLPEGSRTISLYDSNGKLLISKSIIGSPLQIISLRNVAKGALIVKVFTTWGIITKKVVY